MSANRPPVLHGVPVTQVTRNAAPQETGLTKAVRKFEGIYEDSPDIVVSITKTGRLDKYDKVIVVARVEQGDLVWEDEIHCGVFQRWDSLQTFSAALAFASHENRSKDGDEEELSWAMMLIDDNGEEGILLSPQFWIDPSSLLLEIEFIGHYRRIGLKIARAGIDARLEGFVLSRFLDDGHTLRCSVALTEIQVFLRRLVELAGPGEKELAEAITKMCYGEIS